VTTPAASYRDTSWRQLAACRADDPEIFFPIGKSGPALVQAQQAKAVCAHCPVRLRCLAFALDTHQQHGIWGGYDETERRVLHRQRRRQDRGVPLAEPGDGAQPPGDGDAGPALGFWVVGEASDASAADGD
jgi:WhiB family redox-sensing transcriptional regulator